MTTTYHTAITTGESNAPATLNTRFSTLDAQLVTQAAQITTLNTSGVGSVYAQINNASGEGDTSWAIDNISGTFLAGATVVYTVSGVVYTSTVAANTSASPLTVTAAPSVTIPDNTVISQIPAGAAGKFLDGKINAKDPTFGATGDGETDDYAAIVAAINAAPAGGEVLLPPGTYILSQTLVISKSIRLIGASPDTDGGGTVLKPATSFTGTYLVNITSDDVKLENMYLNCTNSAAVQDGIFVEGTPSGSVNFITGVELSNLTIRNTNGTGIICDYAGASTIRNVVCNSGTITIQGDSTSINVLGCYVLNVASNSGYRVLASRYINFSACAVDSSDHYGYNIASTAESVSFVGCGAEVNDRGAFYIAGNACSVVACFGVNNGSACDGSSHVASGVSLIGDGNTVISWHENDETGVHTVGTILGDIYIGGDNNTVIGGTFERGAATDGVKVGASTVGNVIITAPDVDASARVAVFGQTHRMRTSGTGTGVRSDFDVIAGTAGTSYINLGDTDDDDVGRVRYDHTNNIMYFRANTVESLAVHPAGVSLVDGVTAPTAVSGRTFLYVDSADGDLKVRFGDGTTKTIATDT